jgi:hypothetical protein
MDMRLAGTRDGFVRLEPRMRHKALVLGQVRDIEGRLWDVRQIRETKHGFNLLYGSPEARVGYWGGVARLIATQPLIDYWEGNRTQRDGVLFDLPAGRTTLKRVRSRFGFNYHKDLSTFWMQRIEDLDKLSAREFARKHNVDIHVVVDARRRLLGSRVRKLGWWRKPRPIKILRSNVTLREMGEQLGISISHAKRLKDRALRQ